MSQIGMFEDFQDMADEWVAFVWPICKKANCMSDVCILETARLNRESGSGHEPSGLREIWQGVLPDWMLR